MLAGLAETPCAWVAVGSRPPGRRALHGLAHVTQVGRAGWGLQVPLDLWFPACALEAGCGQVRVEGRDGGSPWQGFWAFECSILRFCGHLLPP